jgi:transcriptional regulator with XRE-family HTH domain
VAVPPDSSDDSTARQREAFGARVRSLREATGLSQEKLAEKSGLHRTYISSIERGQRNVSLQNIHALSAALGVSVGELFPESDG